MLLMLFFFYFLFKDKASNLPNNSLENICTSIYGGSEVCGSWFSPTKGVQGVELKLGVVASNFTC